ncbi:hypothetical protein J6590_065457 [Homalodisca vitripennis]|nr:hypothetical protein J6590_065457 [Homalodisca vitripennis]
MTGLRPHLLNEQGSDDNFSDDESSPLTHDIYGGSNKGVMIRHDGKDPCKAIAMGMKASHLNTFRIITQGRRKQELEHGFNNGGHFRPVELLRSASEYKEE